MSSRTGTTPPPTPAPPNLAEMTVDERIELERERAEAERRLVELATTRREAETEFKTCTHAIAAAWRANQARPHGSYTTAAVSQATGIRRSTFDTWAKEDRADDATIDGYRADGMYSLEEFAALARARQAAKDVVDERSGAMATTWREIQANPRTKLELLVAEKRTGVLRPTLRSWLTGTHKPSGPMLTRSRRLAEEEAERTALLASIKSGDRDITEVLDKQNQDECIRKTKVAVLLQAVPGLGPVKVAALLEQHGVHSERPAGRLTVRQRAALIDALH